MQKTGSSQMAVVSNTPLIMALWTNGGLYIHYSLGAVTSLLIPTSKSYFPVKKFTKRTTAIGSK